MIGRLAAVAALALGSHAVQASAGTSRALLVGINEYVRLPDLSGAVNDVELVREILIRQLGFAPANVTVLTNEAATRAGVLGALEALAGQSGPDDFVYVHYSGHGSQVTDFNGDEDDRADETLVPHDGRTTGVPDITDDELAAALARMPTPHVVVTLDSCHSGTATRGEAPIGARRVPPDERVELYQARTRAIVEVDEQAYVLMTAAAPDQVALDGPVGGRSYGLFTYSLSRALAGGASRSPREILQRSQRELAQIGEKLALARMPEPQLEGPAERFDRPLFLRQTVEPPPRLPWVEARKESGEIRLVGAVALGAAPGSLWAIYPEREAKFEPGRALAELVVRRLDGGDALGSVSPDVSAVPGNARAILVLAAPSPERLRVRWSGDASPRQSDLERELRRALPQVEFAQAPEVAQFLLADDGESCRLLGPDGEFEVARIAGADAAQVAARLAELLARAMTAAELLTLDNGAAELELKLGLVAREASPALPVFRIKGAQAHRSPQNSLQVRVEASGDCYLTLVHVDTVGKLTTIFPNPISEARAFLANGALAAGRAVSIPESLHDANAAGFHLDFSPPAGLDTLRAFCMRDPETAKRLRELIARAETGTRPLDALGSRGPLRQLLADELRSTLGRAATRGLTIVAAQPKPEAVTSPAPPNPGPTTTLAGDWSAASLTLRVQE